MKSVPKGRSSLFIVQLDSESDFKRSIMLKKVKNQKLAFVLTAIAAVMMSMSDGLLAATSSQTQPPKQAPNNKPSPTVKKITLQNAGLQLHKVGQGIYAPSCKWRYSTSTADSSNL